MDYPRDEISQRATDTIAHYGGPSRARVYFKFTCPSCGARCTFHEPNTLFERGECHKCGHDAPVERAGFLLELGPQRSEAVRRVSGT
jgi:hypothetical protein